MLPNELVERLERISNADTSRPQYLSENTLLFLHHQLAQALADRIHFRAGIAWSVNGHHSFTNRNFASDQRDEIDANRLDICAHGARGYRTQPKAGGVLGDLLPLDKSELSAIRLASFTVGTGKITRFTENPFGLDKLYFLNGLQQRAGFLRVQV